MKAALIVSSLLSLPINLLAFSPGINTPPLHHQKLQHRFTRHTLTPSRILQVHDFPIPYSQCTSNRLYSATPSVSGEGQDPTQRLRRYAGHMHWYALRCKFGKELKIMRQLRDRCAGLGGVERFAVPLDTVVKSATNGRMVKRFKVRCTGYIFVKMQFTSKIFDTIQEFQNLVSWAGVSYERGRPTLPRPIRPSEAEKFGLNQWKQPPDEGPTEYTVKDIQKYINRKDISALPPEDEEDILDLEVAQVVQKVYKGLKTGDIVRVTANNTFRDDVAVVRKLEDGMATLELYRYGDKQITTMKPQEVSKLSTVDILKRLSPKQPFIENQRGRNFIHRNYVPIKDEYDRFRSGKKKSPTSDFGMDFGDDELFSAGNSWSMAPGRSFRQHQQALSGNPGTDNSWGPSEGISDIPNRSQRQSPPKGASHMLPPPPKNPAKTTSNQYLESFQSDLEQALKDLPASFKEGAPPHGKGSVQPQGNLQSRPQSKLFWDLQNKWRQADELNESTNESNYGTRESDSLKTADHGVQSEGPEDEEKREDAFLDNLIKDLEQYTLSPSSQDVEKEEATSAAASNDMSMEDLEKHSVTELKEMLRKKGLRVSGRKAELISRLAGN